MISDFHKNYSNQKSHPNNTLIGLSDTILRLSIITQLIALALKQATLTAYRDSIDRKYTLNQPRGRENVIDKGHLGDTYKLQPPK